MSAACSRARPADRLSSFRRHVRLVKAHWRCPGLAGLIVTLALVTPAEAQSLPTIVDQHAEDLRIVIDFAAEFKAPQGADFRKLKRLEREVVRRKLLTAADLVNVKAGSASPENTSLFALAAHYAPVKPYHLRVPTDRGALDIVVYHKFWYLRRYLNFYFLQGTKVVGFREADLSQPMPDDPERQPSYMQAGVTVDVWCVPYAFDDVRCAAADGQPIGYSRLQ